MDCYICTCIMVCWPVTTNWTDRVDVVHVPTKERHSQKDCVLSDLITKFVVFSLTVPGSWQQFVYRVRQHECCLRTQMIRYDKSYNISYREVRICTYFHIKFSYLKLRIYTNSKFNIYKMAINAVKCTIRKNEKTLAFTKTKRILKTQSNFFSSKKV